MSAFIPNPTSLKLLICADVDNVSTQKLAAKYISQNPVFSAVIVFGPFVRESSDITAEKNAILEGDVASIIAQLENIVCRVIYLPSENDPSDVITEQLHLTPNSINIHARKLDLTSSLYITGFTEKSADLLTGKLPEDADRSAESDDELDNVELKSGISISIIQEILINTNQQELEASAENQKLSAYEGSGIFALNYKFSHTLNQFLFHMQDHLDTAGIDVCILSCVDPNDDTVTRLPAKFGKLSIVTPKSLRNGGNYTVIDLNLDTSGKKWQVVGIDNLSL